MPDTKQQPYVDIASLESKIKNLKTDVEYHTNQIARHKDIIDNSGELIKIYEARLQLLEVLGEGGVKG